MDAIVHIAHCPGLSRLDTLQWMRVDHSVGCVCASHSTERSVAQRKYWRNG